MVTGIEPQWYFRWKYHCERNHAAIDLLNRWLNDPEKTEYDKRVWPEVEAMLEKNDDVGELSGRGQVVDVSTDRFLELAFAASILARTVRHMAQLEALSGNDDPDNWREHASEMLLAGYDAVMKCLPEEAGIDP